MLEIRRGPNLREKALGADHGGELRLQDLDRDLTVMPEVFGQVDRRHPAAPEAALDDVSAGKRRAEGGDLFGVADLASRERPLRHTRHHLAPPLLPSHARAMAYPGVGTLRLNGES